MKSAERLFQMYLETVGRNSTLILNMPPNKAGVLPTATVNVLKDLGNLLETRLGNDLARTAKVEVTETRAAGASRNYEATNLIDGDKDTYWATNDGTTSATITLTWDTPQRIHFVALQEYIKLGQRVKAFKIETSNDGSSDWTERGGSIQQTTVGYKRIIPLNGSTSNYGSALSVKGVRVTIEDSKACPLLHTLSVY